MTRPIADQAPSTEATTTSVVTNQPNQDILGGLTNLDTQGGLIGVPFYSSIPPNQDILGGLTNQDVLGGLLAFASRVGGLASPTRMSWAGLTNQDTLGGLAYF